MAVVRVAVDSVRDGSLLGHVAASLGRVAVGTVLAIAISVPLGVAMGLSPAVSGFLTPLFRFFSVLAGIAWIPIAMLWFGYGFGAITFVIFNAVVFVVAYNDHPQLFSDLPPIPDDVAIKPGFVFKP